jgi:hypothetical protein
MLSFKTLAVGAALAAIGYAQNVQITGRLQAKSPELGTVYVYKQANDGECESPPSQGFQTLKQLLTRDSY